MEQPCEREEAVGVDRADNAGGLDEQSDDVARQLDVGDDDPGALGGHKAALARVLGIHARVAHGDLRRIRRGRPQPPMPH